MKTAAKIIEKNLLFLMFFYCLFFQISCGLEEVIVVEAPTVTYNDPLYSDDDYTNYYCSFLTKESGQPDSFLGSIIKSTIIQACSFPKETR